MKMSPELQPIHINASRIIRLPEAYFKKVPRGFGLSFLFLFCFLTTGICLAENGILIDPGHGGEDTGLSTSATPQTITEKDFTLALAQACQNALHAAGLEQTEVTRNSDKLLSLKSRQEQAVRFSAGIFLSLHALPAGSSSQAMMYVYDNSLLIPVRADKSGLAAWNNVQQAFLSRSEKLAEELNRFWPRESALKLNKQKAPIAVLAAIPAAAVLLEIPLPKNTQEQERIIAILAQGLSQGLTAYLQGAR
jgi:N-acetylmuramoyl-L-alanine amidase